MKAAVPSAPTKAGEGDLVSLCQELFLQQLRRVDQSRFVLRIPQLRDHVMEHPGFHFHFKPDFVLGIHGRSRFEFIHGSFTLGPGEMAVIPDGIPHRELPLPSKTAPFENLVVSIYNQTLCVVRQTAASRDGEPKAETEYLDTPRYDQCAKYLGDIAELYHSPGLGHELGIKGLLLAYLSTLEAVVKRTRQAPAVEKLKISQVKRLIQENLGSSHLSVRWLAGLLHCSSDYLSNLFHRETGQRLIVYVNAERIKAAVEMLGRTPLTVSEIAFAVGFESPGYFSHVFKKTLFQTPAEYRRTLERSVVDLDGHPRAIYSPEIGGS